MKRLNLLTLLAFCFFCVQLNAQIRYLDPVFDAVDVAAPVVYGTNVSVLPVAQGMPPAPTDLVMNVYTPAGDTDTDRPMVIYIHTGSFLPAYFNGGITGATTDSTAVNTCQRLAKMGYVAATITYRQGWNPTALGEEGQDTRTGTLLQAAYRGIQDARTAVRFLRKDVAESGNTYGIDPDKIVLWGQGTGGYISIGAAYFDRFEEVSGLDKFISSTTALPYLDTLIDGNPFGTSAGQISIPNHVGYSSDFALSVNMGGALGDSTWCEASDAVPTIGFHVEQDPFAPFNFGQVIVPTTGDFVVNVSGSRGIVGRANRLGLNDGMNDVNAILSNNPGDYDPFGVQAANEINKAADPVIPLQGIDPYKLSVDNMYAFRTPTPEAGPWDWWDKATLDVIIGQINAVIPTAELNSDTLHFNGLLTNPNMSAAKGNAYLDTIIAYYAPRAAAVLDLVDLDSVGVVGVNELADQDVNLALAPNPASKSIRITSDAQSPMRAIVVYSMNGTLSKIKLNLDTNEYILDRLGLSPGMYFVKIKFDEGVITKRVIFR